MKNCIITGGNSGIGFESALQIVEKGHHVTIICRNEERAVKACEMIKKSTGFDAIDYLIADLSSIESVVSAVNRYLEKEKRLDVLINNAADFDLSVKSPVITADGLEKQFATNVVAPYLLSVLLMDSLKTSNDGRIINISSQGLCVYPFIKLDFENLDGKKFYTPSNSYYQNKLALLMFSLWMRNNSDCVKIQAVRVTNVKIDMTRYNNISPTLKSLYFIKSKFSIPASKMAKLYTMLACDNEYEGFLYNEKGREVKANAYVYNTSAQCRLIKILDEIVLKYR